MPNAGNKTVSSHSLDELKGWSRPLLQLDEEEFYAKIKKRFINIAGAFSPSATIKIVKDLAVSRGFGPRESDRLASAARWLSMVLRDYGQSEFDKLTKEK